MRVFGLGETVYDIIFKDGSPQAAKPGGSVLNALVSLARTGIETYFISELGKDKIGKLIISFLKENGISTDYVQQYENAQSALALAFLNEKNDASYEFYKNYPDNRLQIKMPDFQTDDILLFGSSFAIDPAIHDRVKSIVQSAKSGGATVIYDPNYRPKDRVNEAQRISYVMENAAAAHLVRASNEDCFYLLGVNDPHQAFDMVKEKCTTLIYTANAEGIMVINATGKLHYSSDKLKPVSTIGAGDNFNAGFIYGLVKHNLRLEELESLTKEQLDKIIPIAKQFAGAVCMSMDNYVPQGFQVKE